MLIVALVLAIIGLAALVTAIVTSNAFLAWVCIATGVIGVVLLIVDAFRGRQGDPRAMALSERGVLDLEHDFPDERPAVDAPIHNGLDHEVQREILREERVLHPDTGPLDPDFTKEEVFEAIRHRPRHGHAPAHLAPPGRRG